MSVFFVFILAIITSFSIITLKEISNIQTEIKKLYRELIELEILVINYENNKKNILEDI